VIAGVLLLVIVLAAVLVWVAATRHRHAGAAPGAAGPRTDGSEIRRFFQYLLLAGLLFASASGVTGLLGRLLAREDVLERDEAALALQLTFTLVALPLFAVLARWTWRRLHAVPEEPRSLSWAAYLTVVGLVSLVVAMTGWEAALSALLLPGGDPVGPALGQAAVWTLVWGVHHWQGPRITPRAHLRAIHLLGSLVGLATAVTGLVGLVSSALRIVLDLDADSIVDTTARSLVDSGVVLLVGAAAWVALWALRSARDERTTGWLVLVLLVGVGGGLVATITAVSLAAYSTLVWLVGDPASNDATEHFGALPGQLAVAVAGVVVWWYHRTLLGAEATPQRTEVRRVYEYLLAAVGLLAAGYGLVMLVVTIVEAVAGRADVLAGASAVNALLGALVLLAVGLPVWWRYWSRAQRARTARPAEEITSPTRRIYLLVLFGLMGVTAVIIVMTLVYLLLEDTLAGDLGVETLRRMRFATGILVTTALLAGYHWSVFRGDRDETAELVRAGVLPPHGPPPVPPQGPPSPPPLVPPTSAGVRRRRVLLVGSADSALEHGMSDVDVEVLRRTDATVPGLSPAEVRELLDRHPDGDLLLLQDPDGVRVVPIRRGHRPRD
jgi:hypothetical protein